MFSDLYLDVLCYDMLSCFMCWKCSCSLVVCVVFFVKQKTAYEMRISYWSLDVCSSDLDFLGVQDLPQMAIAGICRVERVVGRIDGLAVMIGDAVIHPGQTAIGHGLGPLGLCITFADVVQPFEPDVLDQQRSEEHTSELQSLMRISYAVFCLKKKKNYKQYQ